MFCTSHMSPGNRHYSVKNTNTMDWNLLSSRWIFCLNAVLFLLQVTLAKSLDPINLSKYNEDFRLNPNGVEIEAEIDDIIDIVCPQAQNTDDVEYHSLVQVQEPVFRRCNQSIPNTRTRKLLDCNRPYERNLYTLLFQRFTPFPGRPYFEEGQTYYFITTSDGTRNGMNQQSGGLCASHHMKFVVHIGPRPAVIFDGEITLLSLGGVVLDWDNSLQDHNSPRYTEVTVEVETALHSLYKDIEGYQKVEVTGYRHGSVIVEFQVHFAEGSTVNIATIQGPLQETAFNGIMVDRDSVYVGVTSRSHQTTQRTTSSRKAATTRTPEKPQLLTTTRTPPPRKPITSNEVLIPKNPALDKNGSGKEGQMDRRTDGEGGENSSSRTQLSLITLFVSFLCAVVRWHHH